MKKLAIISFSVVLFACNNKSSSGTEERKDTIKTDKTDTSKKETTQAPATGDEKKQMTLDGVADPGKVAYAVFKQGNKTLFYYNVDSKKGMISIDGTKYDFTSYTHTINEPDYTLKAGTDLTVMVTGTKMHEYEDPEPGILKGKAAKVVITLKGAALELTDVDVVDGTNAD